MKVVNAQQMRDIDRVTIKEYGIPSLVLMERAGLSVVKRIGELYDKSRRVLILSGGGDNGGDGLVVARSLHNEGWDVKVYLLSSVEKLSKDCLTQYEIAKKMGVKTYSGRLPSLRDIKGALLVDAIIGTGLNKPVKDQIARLIERINCEDAEVVAVDIPSGISSDNGEVMGVAVRANVTVTFGLPKVGHLLSPGANYSGRLFIEDIGFPPALLSSDVLRVELIERSQARMLLPERERDSHKGFYGHIVIGGGSVGKTGALLLSAKAALRSGAGLVTIATSERIIDSLMASVLEEMTLPLSSTQTGSTSKDAARVVLDFLYEKGDVLAIGPGLGMDRETVAFVLETLQDSPVPVVVDADALNALSMRQYREIIRFLNRMRSPAVLTPHLGEMSRLTKIGIKDVKRERIDMAKKFAMEAGVYLVLKGVPTVIVSPEGQCYVNSTGNAGMATAGTGDVLSGVIASFIGQGLPPMESSILGVYIHGLSGDIAAQEFSEYSVTAKTIIDTLPLAFNSLLKE